ncbi:Pol polyprotein [Plakobranchus ocellatus]|uniref:Pol polyprotein n=1 Tax=Plakobranchus ocellatus TaxID=259542 RepID=A0AAV4CD95_9GAST|nr:Pol polyprotein [Plakobranchus ocellatus]
MDGPTVLAFALALRRKTKKKIRRKWAKNWFLKRKKFGHSKLLDELGCTEPSDFRNFLRMDEDSFDELLELVRPCIKKQDTNMRDAISPTDKLSITLRFLATGNSFEDLKFISAISPQAIGSIVMETCNALIKCLQSDIKVQDVKELLLEFQDILTSAPGCTNTLCHEIRLTTDDVIRVKPYPLPFAARDFVTQEVNDLLALGVIEPSDSHYCFPIVVEKKKDGSMRLCIDFRKLNAVTVFDAENIPRQEDLFNQLSHVTILSSCDLCKAYWQVPLHPDGRKYTAFQTPLGLMQWGTPEKVQWTPRCDQSLAEIKRLFSSPPILIIPDMQETFIVRSDASDFGIGAVLDLRMSMQTCCPDYVRLPRDDTSRTNYTSVGLWLQKEHSYFVARTEHSYFIIVLRSHETILAQFVAD